MPNEGYTSPVAQTIEATGEAVRSTSPFIIYYLVTVSALVGVLYLLLTSGERYLQKIDDHLVTIDKDLQMNTQILRERLHAD